MTYAEVFLLVWAVVATFIAAAQAAKVRRFALLIGAVLETTKRITLDDEHRDAARRLYESLGATRQLDKG